jgi:hypothetical protein
MTCWRHTTGRLFPSNSRAYFHRSFPGSPLEHPSSVGALVHLIGAPFSQVPHPISSFLFPNSFIRPPPFLSLLLMTMPYGSRSVTMSLNCVGSPTVAVLCESDCPSSACVVQLERKKKMRRVSVIVGNDHHQSTPSNDHHQLPSCNDHHSPPSNDHKLPSKHHHQLPSNDHQSPPSNDHQSPLIHRRPTITINRHRQTIIINRHCRFRTIINRHCRRPTIIIQCRLTINGHQRSSSPLSNEHHQSPSNDHHQLPSPSSNDHHQSPLPSPNDHHESPLPSPNDHQSSLPPSNVHKSTASNDHHQLTSSNDRKLLPFNNHQSPPFNDHQSPPFNDHHQ